MAYYTEIFSPKTYEALTRSNQTIAGFPAHQKNAASRIRPGDKFVCYINKVSRWVGILEVTSESFEDNIPIFLPENDPFVIRFRVKPLVWLPIEKAVPVQEDRVWGALSFTKEHNKGSTLWTGKIRKGLNILSNEDGRFLEELLKCQKDSGQTYEIDESEWQRLVGSKAQPVRPETPEPIQPNGPSNGDHSGGVDIRESYQIQALLAQIGDEMGLEIWLPQSDRSNVLQLWKPTGEEVLLAKLPQFHGDPSVPSQK